jgi:hypothetical protein
LVGDWFMHWIDRLKVGWMDGCVGGWVDWWKDRCTNERMDGWRFTGPLIYNAKTRSMFTKSI